MSIFASLAAPSDDEHVIPGCALYVEESLGCFEFSGKPCDCGQPDAPLKYQGSHVMPSDDDERGGSVDLALIPGHVRVYRDNPDADSSLEDSWPPEPFLRFGVNGETVILTRRHVEQIAAELSEWLAAQPAADSPRRRPSRSRRRSRRE